MVLSISGLNQFYGQSHILWDLDLEVEPASCTCIMGRNGVGKTTLLRCIMGILPARSGSIKFGDAELTTIATERRARIGIGYVPQAGDFFPTDSGGKPAYWLVCQAGWSEGDSRAHL